MDFVTPVFKDLKHKETVIRGGVNEQGVEVATVVGLVSTDQTKTVTYRFRLSDDEREAVLQGSDLMLSIQTYGRGIPPVMLWHCSADVEASDIPWISEAIGDV